MIKIGCNSGGHFILEGGGFNWSILHHGTLFKDKQDTQALHHIPFLARMLCLWWPCIQKTLPSWLYLECMIFSHFCFCFSPSPGYIGAPTLMDLINLKLIFKSCSLEPTWLWRHCLMNISMYVSPFPIKSHSEVIGIPAYWKDYRRASLSLKNLKTVSLHEVEV